MPTIYFDNFRGFENTYLNLKSVNFFAGENSTGKTSVLKLLGILTSVGFWRYGEFGEGDTSLGGFEDIITTPRVHSKEYLEFGVFNDEIKEDARFSALKFRFINSDNFPYLKEVGYINDEVNLQAIIDGNFIKYRYRFQSTHSFKNAEFKSWIENNGLGDLNFSKIELQYNAILPILDVIKGQIAKEREPKSYDFLKVYDKSLFLSPIVWISPIRAEPQRTYNRQGLIYNPKGSHSPSVLKEIFLGPNVKEILNKFGADSGLYDDIIIKDISDSKDSSSFELLISINNVPRNIIDVGFGVSQVLPIVVETIARQNNLWFAMQSPEAQLHPRAQAALGDLIFKTHVKDGQRFVIETHSDYLIDRFRLRVNRAFREKIDSIDDLSQVIFFTRSESGNRLDTIPINYDGSYPEEQPKQFRDFFIREQLEIISI